MITETKLTIALISLLLGWSGTSPPDFWSGIARPDERFYQEAVHSAAVALDAADPSRAVSSAVRAVDRMPNRFEGHLLLALAREEMLEPSAATSFARALALEPRWAEHPVAADYASSAFARTHDFARAAELACTAARSMDPSPFRADLFERCGAALMAIGPDHLEDARRTLELGEPEHPTPGYVVALALAFDRADAHEHALALLRPYATRAYEEHETRRLVGTDEDRFAAQGLVAESTSRLEEAIAAYLNASARGPWSTHARHAHLRLISQPTIVRAPPTRGALRR